MSFDQIADMLARIRNAQQAGRKDVSMPASRLKLAIARKLHANNFIGAVSLHSEGNKKYLKLALKYEDKNPAIKEIKRISRQGQRIYVGKNEISNVKSGYGISIVSTSKGILTNKEARKEGIGGEVICEVY